jgi:hypothetical protein
MFIVIPVPRGHQIKKGQELAQKGIYNAQNYLMYCIVLKGVVL